MTGHVELNWKRGLIGRDDTSSEWTVMPGSSDFRIRERSLRPDELKDTHEQVHVFEIDWDDGGTGSR